MLDRLIHFSIHHKLIIGLFTLGLVAWGLYSVTQLPVDAVPDITNNQVQVITPSPSLAAQEVEQLITFPVELTMATIPDVEEIRSFSRFGLSVVTIVFEEGVDIYWARQQVSERLAEAAAQIPAGVSRPALAPISTGLGEIYQYLLRPQPGYEAQYTAMELRTLQDWIVRRGLLGTPGVADVSSFGGYLKQYEIAVDPARLRSLNLTLQDLFAALEKNNQNTGGAYIDKKPRAYFIRTEGLVESLEDIRRIVVKRLPNGTPLLLQDVGQVRFGHAVRYGAMTRNTDGEVVGGIVLMLKGANSAQVIRAVKDRVATLQESLPEGVVIEPFLDRTALINRAVGTVTKNLTEGALIVIFVLVLFLGNWRAGLVVASVIPLALLFALGLMNLFGVSANLMSLGAIDFGLIVDGTVIIVESVVHRITSLTGRQKLTRGQMDQEVYTAASRIRSSAAFGEIIILIVYLPILALVGVEGKMFRPMAQTVSFAILGAFLLSLTYVPMLSALLLSRKTYHRRNFSDRMMDGLQRGYDPVLAWALRRKGVVVAAAVGLLGGSLWVFSGLGGEFIPTLDEGDFAVETRVLTGSSLSQTIEASQQAAAVLLEEFPDEVEEVVGKIGSSEIPTDPMPIEAIDLMVLLKDKATWTRAASQEELAGQMNEALEAVPGVTFSFQQPIQMRFNELMTGAKQDVVVKIYGDDLEELSRQAQKVGRLVQQVEGAADLYVEQVTGLPQVVVDYRREQLAKYGLDVATVNRTVQAAFAGAEAGTVYEGDRRFGLVVRLQEAARQGIENVENLFVATPDGDQIPLAQVADVAFRPGPYQIQRDDTRRRILVAFNVRGRDVESVVDELQRRVSAQIDFPAGYFVTYGGQFENLVEARQRLSVAVPVALVLIFLLLYFTFGSVAQSLLIFTAIPLSAIGGILALWGRGMPFSISAGIGFIALFGVAVLNGIVLIGEFNHLRDEGVTDLLERVRAGTRVRLRPVLMTASVASLGFLPMALSSSAGAEVQRPLATVVIGGLVSATLLTLLVLPVLYVYFERGWGRVKAGPAVGVWLLVGLGLSLWPTTSQAQERAAGPYTREEAIATALAQNGQVRIRAGEVARQQALQRTATALPKTEISLQYGQYNSLARDNNLQVSQRFPFPTVWSSRAALAGAQVEASQYAQAVTENELIRQVKEAYNQLAYEQSRGQLLAYQDSLLQAFVRAARVRYRTGETNLLEQATAESEAAQLRTRLTQHQADLVIARSRLQVLLHEEAPVYITADTLSRLTPDPAWDTTRLASNPTLAYFNQQVDVARREEQLQRAQRWPELTLGYFSQSLIGFEPGDGSGRYYGPWDRFTGVQVGLALPLWWGPYQAEVKAAALQQQVARDQQAYARQTLTGDYRQALQQFAKFRSSLSYYEENALPQARLILENAQLSFQTGAIGYVEFVQALERALAMQIDYLALLRQYNESIIYLEFLGGAR
ncbi:cobalt-zinc-cadmium resistance protein CzcA [Catalinimonas alkaloidigena]|uniref:Cobalt-zinc-cadmium resistance protein CzcA n=1 Tax=Catalinimonas alkaloidigena TaxID=1075417 RepID=A0A1G9VN39_9BACT|nr:CusA/CzcA family heavy metal efflux RND transporter [Catalinimonas alkaloidigena]SDM73652.1 cobalt-zinc-cadmium resistance protein CzcA [Catalinimonas alkaloidigena]